MMVLLDIFINSPHSEVCDKEEHSMATSILNGKTMLVVDDEQDILDIMRDSLESQGYKVFATSDSTVAMDIYRRIFNDVALVISDIAMPGIDGRELIRQIKGINPDIKILAVSGYSRYVAGNDEIKEIAGFIQKPFDHYQLRRKIDRLMETKLSGSFSFDEIFNRSA